MRSVGGGLTALIVTLVTASAPADDEQGAVSAAPSTQASATATASATQKVEHRAEAEEEAAESNSHAYRNIPQWRVAPSAGTTVGYGVEVPSLHSATYSFEGRLGVAVETSDRVTLVLNGMTGVTLGFNTGSSSPFYGYLVRVPLLAAPEVIFNEIVSYRNKRFLNLHIGALVGADFLLAAQCVAGACDYILPGTYFALGARAGLSYSAVERSSIGLFVTWQTDFAPCPPSAQASCATGLSTLTWSIGWSLF
jgi:hypothetical protein